MWWIAVLVAIIVFLLLRKETFEPENDTLEMKIHNAPPVQSMFQLGINGRIAIARRNPTPDGTTYEIPLAKYGKIENISIVVYGTKLTVDSIRLRGKDVMRGFIYTGTDLAAVTQSTVPKGTHVQNGNWSKEGVYTFIV